jgi:hypothetical protein
VFTCAALDAKQLRRTGAVIQPLQFSEVASRLELIQLFVQFGLVVCSDQPDDHLPSLDVHVVDQQPS